MIKIVLIISLTMLSTFAKVTEIKTPEEFKTVIAQKNRLLIFDLYADWCMPCKQLSPILEDVSNSYTDSISFYKINTDKLPAVSNAFGTKGIPYVVFFKNNAIVNALTGLYPKEAYEQYAEIFSSELRDSADGIIKNGVREITISSTGKIGNILTNKGDSINLIIKGNKKPQTLSIKDFSIEKKMNGKNDLLISFSTKTEGAFPIILDDGAKKRGWILVSSKKELIYKDADAKEFKSYLSMNNSFLLDVRTLGEYNNGHIDGATLIPVQELEKRINEISDEKDKSILIYCRSGNRSVAASQILKAAGFSSIVNLKSGIKGWIKAGFPIKK